MTAGRVPVGLALLTLGALLALAAACDGDTESPAKTPAGQTPAAGETASPAATGFSLTSEAFEDGGTIPERFTCDGEDLSPPLAWDGVPSGTQSFALIVDDPDAPGGTFTHWLLYNLPPDSRPLAEGVMIMDRPVDGMVRLGRNDFGDQVYGGPCPPPGNPHHYRFTLYALDEAVDLGPGALKQDLLSALDGHVLAQAELVGMYGR